MNVLNSLSVFALNDIGVKGIIASFESSKRGVEELYNPVPVGHITYGYLPLMRMRACPNKHQENCKNCKGVSTIKDRMNVEFTLICNNKKFTTLLNSVPLCVFDENIKSDFNLLYFTVESPERVKEIFELSQNNSAPNFTRTKGLYFKNLK
jgi:putative protease